MNLTLIGSLALDSIKTPFGKVENALGGSALFASIAASFFSPCGIVGVVGKDFPKKAFEILSEKNIDTQGIEIKNGKTFHWEGYYDYDLNTAHTLNTQLNVFAEFNPVLPENYKNAKIIFLANIDPDLQEKVLQQAKKKKLVLLDTMNYWIENKRNKLLKVIKQSDVILLNDAEARELAKTANILKAAQKILSWGPSRVIIKKGEHGCIMVSKNKKNKFSLFTIPAYPLEEIYDPTGAGDTFAGTLCGYLANKKELNDENFRKAIVLANVFASFTVEDFSIKGLLSLTKEKILQRYDDYKEIITYEEESLRELL